LKLNRCLEAGAQHGARSGFHRSARGPDIFYCSLAQGETKTFAYRVKPVAAGTFVIPPVFAESMYDRGINGRSGGGQVVAEPAP